MAKSNFVAMINQETCEECGTCADERCPMDAIAEDNGGYRVKPERCIGCGVCTTTCPTESISLIRKPEGSAMNRRRISQTGIPNVPQAVG